MSDLVEQAANFLLQHMEPELCNAVVAQADEIKRLTAELEKQKRLTKTALRVPFMRSTPKGWEYIPEDDDE